MENHQLAIIDFDNVIKYDAGLSDGYYRRGWSKFFLKRFREAIEDFKAAKEKELEFQNVNNTSGNENWGILSGIGCCHQALKEYTKAIEYYDSAIEGDPTNTDFLLNRAQCNYDTNQYEKTLADLQIGNQINPTDSRIHYRIGLAHYKNGDLKHGEDRYKEFKKAIKILKLALVNNP